MRWKTSTHTFDLHRSGLIIGILNLTPDSFSDGGLWTSPDQAVEHAHQMAADGASIIDIGGESTRPGAKPVSETEELQRVIPIIKKLSTSLNAAISIDTTKPSVALAAIQSGATIINDISGLRSQEMRQIARQSRAGIIAMHMQGSPQTMQSNPTYENVVATILSFIHTTHQSLISEHIDPESIVYDPGIGFGKTTQHNLQILKAIPNLCSSNRPLLVGASRKSFIANSLQSNQISERSWPTVAITSYARTLGATLFRVHEVRRNHDALRMTEAILYPSSLSP